MPSAYGLGKTLYLIKFSSVQFTQSDQGLSFPSEETLDHWLLIDYPFGTLIKLRGTAGWVESSIDTHANLTFGWTSTFNPLSANRFSGLLKCLRSLYVSVDPDQTAPTLCTGSTLFASILKLVINVWQLFAADNFSRRHFQMHFSWRFKG